MESCDADVIEIGGDEADARASSLHELNTKVETGLPMFIQHFVTLFTQTTMSTWCPRALHISTIQTLSMTRMT